MTSARRTFAQRAGRLGDRLFDRLRHSDAFTITDDTAGDDDLEGLRDHRFAVLVTFRRNGTAVPSPVWFAIDRGGRAYIKTGAHAGKAKRIRSDDRALVAPSTRRGKPTGQAIRCSARLLPPDEWPEAECALRDTYGIVRRAFERLLGGADEPAYIELRAPRDGS